MLQCQAYPLWRLPPLRLPPRQPWGSLHPARSPHRLHRPQRSSALPHQRHSRHTAQAPGRSPQSPGRPCQRSPCRPPPPPRCLRLSRLLCRLQSQSLSWPRLPPQASAGLIQHLLDSLQCRDSPWTPFTACQCLRPCILVRPFNPPCASVPLQMDICCLYCMAHCMPELSSCCCSDSPSCRKRCGASPSFPIAPGKTLCPPVALACTSAHAPLPPRMLALGSLLGCKHPAKGRNAGRNKWAGPAQGIS